MALAGIATTSEKAKSMGRMTAALVLGLFCTLAGLIAAQAEEPAERPLKPCVVITGADSNVVERRYQQLYRPMSGREYGKSIKDRKRPVNMICSTIALLSRRSTLIGTW
jgi:hypothetical protein